jgi:hypothetical protein
MTAKSYVYVFVRIKEPKPASNNATKRKTKSEGVTDEISYYPVTSGFVAKNVHRPGGTKKYRPKGWSIWLNKIEKFKNNWNVFGPFRS